MRIFMRCSLFCGLFFFFHITRLSWCDYGFFRSSEISLVQNLLVCICYSVPPYWLCCSFHNPYLPPWTECKSCFHVLLLCAAVSPQCSFFFSKNYITDVNFIWLIQEFRIALCPTGLNFQIYWRVRCHHRKLVAVLLVHPVKLIIGSPFGV